MSETLHLEETPCPLCKSDQFQPAYDFSPYQLVRCRQCGLYYLSPRLTESAMLDHYRQDSYYEQGEAGYDSYLEQETTLRQTFARLFINLKRDNMVGGDLLEVGCGYGFLLDEAKSYFDKRVGTDFSSEAVEYASQYADAVYLGGLDELPQDKQFDCIITTNVIEHVYDPIPFVQNLTSYLKPGGLLVTATPNMDSFIRHILRDGWPSFKSPEHVTYFDRRTLSDLMRRAGLTDIRPLAFPHAFPLSLIGRKLGLSLSPEIGQRGIFVPTTMVAVTARRPLT